MARGRTFAGVLIVALLMGGASRGSAQTLVTADWLEFGRKQARLLQDAQYFEAFKIVQAMNLGRITDTPANRRRFQKANEELVAAEKRLFPAK